MFIGKWNKSVILTYVGLAFAIFGMYLSFHGSVLPAISCLLVAGICDMFDGFVARKCKRTDEEKRFGIELDSLVDTISFVAFPIVLLFNMGLTSIYYVPIYILFGIAGVARLGYFNISLDDENKDVPIKHYTGLPVTFIALTIPLAQLIVELANITNIGIYYGIIMFVTAVLNIAKIKVTKPKGIAYPIALIMAIITLVLFLGVL